MKQQSACSLDFVWFGLVWCVKTSPSRPTVCGRPWLSEKLDMIILINACQLTSIMQNGNFRINFHLKSKPYGKFVASDCQEEKCFPGLQQGA